MKKSLAPVDFGNPVLVDQCPEISVHTILRQLLTQTKVALLNDGVNVGEQAVQITETPGQFGGARLWLRCPLCQSRRAILYQHPIAGAIGCRACLGLKYRKSRYKGMREERL